jgi:hypothetical protein
MQDAERYTAQQQASDRPRAVPGDHDRIDLMLASKSQNAVTGRLICDHMMARLQGIRILRIHRRRPSRNGLADAMLEIRLPIRVGAGRLIHVTYEEFCVETARRLNGETQRNVGARRKIGGMEDAAQFHRNSEF